MIRLEIALNYWSHKAHLTFLGKRILTIAIALLLAGGAALFAVRQTASLRTIYEIDSASGFSN